MKRVKELEKIIKEANASYYLDGSSSISDEEYDNLVDELRKLNPKSLVLKEVGSNTQSSFKKVKHKIPMGSLMKVNTLDEVNAWFKKYAESKNVVWSEKIDGLSVSVSFINGEFNQAVTRGDGIEGEDITENVRKMIFSKTLKKKYTGEIRGEIFLSKEKYTNLEEKKANPRNAAAGMVRRLDAKNCDLLEILFYQIENLDNLKKESDKMKFIESLGLKTPNWGSFDNTSKILKVWQNYENKIRDELDYEVDGLVLIIDDLESQLDLGIVDGRPRFARAYKFSPQSAVSIIESVDWQVGRTGRITPVAKIKPVSVNGVTISSISLHNPIEIQRKDIELHRPVKIERKGDVIPQVVESLGKTKKSFKIKSPTTCPSCNEKLIQEDIFLVCNNSKRCPEQRIQNLLFWMEVLDIKGFGDKLVQKLFENEKIKEIKDFYNLSEEDISSLDRSGEKIAKKILKELHSKKEIEPEIFIKGLGIEGFGESKSKLIFEKYSINDLLTLTSDQLLAIHGIGPELSQRIVSGIKDKKNEILSLLKIIQLKEKVKGSLTGKSFCFTEVRDKILEADLKAQGASISDSVSKGLNYLIVKNKNGDSSKIQKAKKYNIPIIEIQEVRSYLKI